MNQHPGIAGSFPAPRRLAAAWRAAALAATVLATWPSGTTVHAGTFPAYERILDGPPVFDGTGPVERPWLGGWEAPRPQLEDADGDGDADLFVFEDLGKLRFYVNEGTPSAPDFVLLTDDWGGAHALYFGRVVDANADGKLDLLAEAPEFEVDVGGQTVFRTGAYLYTNVGTSAAPILLNQSTHPDGYLADTSGAPIPMLTTSPDLVDLEGDGDVDLLFGDPSGAIILYRNVGSPAVPAFQFETDHYQDLLIVFGSCTGEEAGPRTLGQLLAAAGGGLRHGYMLFSFFDVNGDGRPDLFLGDQFNANVYFLENLGGTPNPTFECRTQDYFPPQPDFAQYLVATFGDLDGDGDPDALVGSGISGDTGLHHFRNVGSASAPVFTLADADYLPELDLGRSSAPTFADLDGGGLPDLFLATGSEQRVALFGNYGTASAPEFALEAPSWLVLPGAAWAAPEFADLDADGDLDRFVGMTSGAVRWWRNDGAGTSASFTEVTDDPAFGDSSTKTIRQALDAQAVPRFLDDDGDGDLDLVLGSWRFSGSSRLLLFRNDGTPQSPAMVLASTDWRALGALGQQLAPVFGDQDGDGDADLIVGRYDGTLVRFENTGDAVVPSFAPPGEVVAGVDVGTGAVPALLDLDDDGNLDLVLGETGGGLSIFRAAPILSTEPPSPPSPVAPSSALRLTAGPVPARHGVSVSVDWPTAGRGRVEIFDLLGRRVATLADADVEPGRFELTWSGRPPGGARVAAGVYLCRATLGATSVTRRLVLLR